MVLENHSFSEVAGHSPYLNALARDCGLATDYTAITHPSLPNYLALTSGGTDGVTSDCTSCTVQASSLFGQLGGDWRSYLQALPSQGYRGAFSGAYAKKHNPAAYYTRVADYARDALPLGALPGGLSRGSLARFNLIVPDLCDDEHDCSVDTGDRWLQAWMPRILRSQAYRNGRTALFVTYDEGSGGDNRVYTVVVAPSVRRGTVSAEPFDHYSLLRTIERMLGLPCLAAACRASSMAAPFHLLAP